MRQNPHVRICGGPGSATTLVYPTPGRCGPPHRWSRVSKSMGTGVRRVWRVGPTRLQDPAARPGSHGPGATG